MHNDSGSPQAPASTSSTALVLSGGGARMSFQIGALRYLYGMAGIRPSIITSTSAGSIIAGVLAQESTSEGQLAKLMELARAMTSLTSQSELFRLSPLAQEIARSTGAVDPERAVDLSRTMAVLEALDVGTAAAHEQNTADASHATGEGDAEGRQSVLMPGPAMEQIVGAPLQDSARVAASGVALRVSMVSLESGDVHYATEDGAIVDREGTQIAPAGTVDVADAIMASCALPGYLPPVEINGEHYMDGGLREFLPVEMAMDVLGATDVIAVSTRPLGTDRLGSFADAGIVEIMSRMHGDVSADEGQRDEVANARRHGARVVQCQAPAHGVFEFDVALVLLSVDDGWMAAAATVTGADPQEGVRLTALRRALVDAFAAGEPGTIEKARADLAAALETAPAELLPPHARAWLLEPHELLARLAQGAAGTDARPAPSTDVPSPPADGSVEES